MRTIAILAVLAILAVVGYRIAVKGTQASKAVKSAYTTAQDMNDEQDSIYARGR